MHYPDLICPNGKAWKSKSVDCHVPILWFANLPTFHPMLQWFSVAVSNESEEGWQDPELYVYAVDPESYLFQEPDADRWREQKITFLPDTILKHQIPKALWKQADVIASCLVEELIEGRLRPDVEDQVAMHNFLVNLEKWR